MKLLLDNCVWGGALDELVKHGHDVEWVGNWNEDPGVLKFFHEHCFKTECS